MPKTEKEMLADMSEKIGDLVNAVTSLHDRLKVVEGVKPPAPKSRTIIDDKDVKAEIMEDSGIKGAPLASGMEGEEPTEYPVPKNYKAVKNQVLGEDFKIRMMVEADSPTFTLQIIVPQDKSTMHDIQKELSQKDKDKQPIDIRTMSFSQGSSANSIMEWLVRIRQELKLDA